MQSAFQALCYLLQGRDHSERELRAKLKTRFTASELDDALQQAHEKGLLRPPQQLSENWARQWHRRNKGHLYIQNQLKQKGLPPVARDSALELQKAHQVLQKLQARSPDAAKLSRQLMTRGFEYDTIKQVLQELRPGSEATCR